MNAKATGSYKCMRIDGRRRYTHRVVMERKLGRPLSRSEFVYHINGDRGDNREKNLTLVNAKDHAMRRGRAVASSYKANTILTEIQAKGVKAVHRAFPDRPLSRIAKDFHVETCIIKAIVEGRKFPDVTPDLRYSRRDRPDYDVAEEARRLRPQYDETIEEMW